VAGGGPTGAAQAPQASPGRHLDHHCRPPRRHVPHHVWALDFQPDVTAGGRVIKILHVVDEFTRESLSERVGASADVWSRALQVRVAPGVGERPRWWHGQRFRACRRPAYAGITRTGSAVDGPGSRPLSPVSPELPRCLAGYLLPPNPQPRSHGQ
jgi:hypothetical protein